MNILILLRKPLQSLLKLVLPIYLSRISPVRQEKGRYHVINTVNFIVASSFDPLHLTSLSSQDSNTMLQRAKGAVIMDPSTDNIVKG